MSENGIGENIIGIKRATALIKGVLDDFPAFILVLGDGGDIVYHNSEASRIMGKGLTQADAGRLLSAGAPYSARGPRAEREIEYDGRWYRVWDADTIWTDEKPSRLIVGVDVTQIKASEEQFKISATTDSMTGILNRQAGIDRLENMIQGVKAAGTVFSACYFDINDLKYTNDTFGHTEGDAYINTVVAVVKNAIRQTDVFARMGGDEFLILFPGCRLDVVENIMGTVMTRFDVINETAESSAPRYSISYGVMEVNAGSPLDSEHILNAVDGKMYAMKEEYRRTNRRANQKKDDACLSQRKTT